MGGRSLIGFPSLLLVRFAIGVEGAGSAPASASTMAVCSAAGSLSMSWSPAIGSSCKVGMALPGSVSGIFRFLKG